MYDDTIRISVGLEDVEDLIEDFTQAVKKYIIIIRNKKQGYFI